MLQVSGCKYCGAGNRLQEADISIWLHDSSLKYQVSRSIEELDDARESKS